MRAIVEIQKDIVECFSEFENAFDQYAYLIEIAGLFTPMDPALKIESNLVKGCQSKTWLNVLVDEQQIFRLEADSDTFIIKGALAILQEMLDGQTIEDVARAEINFHELIPVFKSFDDKRQKGIVSITKTIIGRAKELSIQQ